MTSCAATARALEAVPWRLAVVLALAGALISAGCSASDAKDELASLKGTITGAAASALEAIENARAVGSAAAGALDRAARGTREAEEAIGSAADLSVESRTALERARSQLDDARGALESAAASAKGEMKDALEGALVKVDELAEQIGKAVSE